LQYVKNKEKNDVIGSQEPTTDTQIAKDTTAYASEKGAEFPLKTPVEKEPPLFFEDPEQLIKPETAYVITSILKGVIDEPGGTGGKARSIGRPLAGKTGSTSDYFDAWFVGFSPDIATGVWVGFDNEKTLGKGEVGGRSALPIWIEYMKGAHTELPIRDFEVPENIVFANIDNETGKLASAAANKIIRQAFMDGTEPSEKTSESQREEEDQNFFKEDLSE
jgi:penicillin-binding protein 1A